MKQKKKIIKCLINFKKKFNKFATNIFTVNKNKLNFKKIFINKFKVSNKNIKDCKKYNYL
jgi:hypothetical protein